MPTPTTERAAAGAGTQQYDDKSAAYFGSARREILPLLPAYSARVLELGCGTGVTLAWLRDIGRAGHTTGIEIHAPAAAQARSQADAVHHLDFENAELPDGTEAFDLVLCLDVLEHFVDPWRAVDRLARRYLRDGGTIVVSVPNIRNFRVLSSLVFLGRWDYVDQGTLDRTHLRFFTRRSARGLLAHPLLGAPRCLPTGIRRGSPKGLLDALTLGIFQEFFAFQYLVAAMKKPSSAGE